MHAPLAAACGVSGRCLRLRPSFGHELTTSVTFAAGSACRYSNMCMMFSSIILYALFMSVIVYVTTLAPTEKRFTLRDNTDPLI